MKRVLLLAVLVATAAATLPAAPATALHSTASCGTYAGYKVKARNVGCRFARRWSIRGYQTRARPVGYRCSFGTRRSTIRLFCYSGAKAYFMQR